MCGSLAATLSTSNAGNSSDDYDDDALFSFYFLLDLCFITRDGKSFLLICGLSTVPCRFAVYFISPVSFTVTLFRYMLNDFLFIREIFL